MSISDLSALWNQWLPVAASQEVEPRGICHVKLLGQELAVWRSDDGQVHAWENRCAHRSVRLTIGINLGSQLQCQYHGWRYAAGSGQCSRIPAHPNLVPARSICIRRFPVHEKYGFVWSSMGGPTEPPTVRDLDDARPLILRSLPYNVAAGKLALALTQVGLEVGPDASDGSSSCKLDVKHLGSLILRATDRSSLMAPSAILFIQPAEDEKTVLHGWWIGAIQQRQALNVLRSVNRATTALRRRLEVEYGRSFVMTGPVPSGDGRARTSSSAS